MDILRTILIVLGVVLVVGIYLYDRIKRIRDKQEQDWNDIPFEGDNDDLGSFSTQDEALPDEWVSKAVTISAKRNERLADEQLESLKGLATTYDDVMGQPQAERKSSMQAERTSTVQQEEVIVLTLMADEGKPFRGPLLLKVLRENGLQHGEMGIFHFHLGGGGQPLFSVANILEPGHFELSEITSLETPGLALFMRLPTVVAGEPAMQTLQQHAQQMASQLGGILCDAQRRPLDEAALSALQHKANTYSAIPS